MNAELKLAEPHDHDNARDGESRKKCLTPSQDDGCCAVCDAMTEHDSIHDREHGGDDNAADGGMIHFGSYTLPLKRVLVFGGALVLWAAGLLLQVFGPKDGWTRFLPLAPFLAAYALAGLPVLRSAFRHILRGKALDENFLMAIATIGAFAIGEWEEAVGVMIFYMIGELVQEAAVVRSRRSINALLALKPDTARVQDGDGWATVAAGGVAIGALILVRPGERIPLDGIITGGEGAIDASMLSGESKPVDVKAGDEVRSGAVSVDGVLTIRATKTADDSSAARIIALVESARDAKAKPERFITAFAKWYTPIVVGAAALLAIVPPLFIPEARFADWLYRALILLIISCPCALVVSIPLGYFAGIGGLSRRGIMVKGAVHLDTLYKTKFVAFDKTGTLTQGKFAITALECMPGVSETELLETAVLAERESNHPIAEAIRKGGLERGIAPGAALTDDASSAGYREIAGRGIELSGRSRGEDPDILAGNKHLLEERGIALPGRLPLPQNGLAGEPEPMQGGGLNGPGLLRDAGIGGPVLQLSESEGHSSQSAVYVARGGRFLGRILIGDTDKEGAREAVAELRGLGISETVMFTGDAREPALAAGKRLGISTVKAELLPADKITQIEELTRRGTTIFVGDGINDAPVLARSDVGIAMGSGADAAVEAADVIIMSGDPRRVPEAIMRARKTRGIVVGNVAFALGAKGLFIVLAILGMANMWLALFADVGVCLLAILNSTRVSHVAIHGLRQRAR